MVMRHTLPFAALLRRYRLAAGLTQEVLAARASLSVRCISDLERGVRHAPYQDTGVGLDDPGAGPLRACLGPVAQRPSLAFLHVRYVRE
jgi:DNA-binding XRE family transcriptional regulator